MSLHCAKRTTLVSECFQSRAALCWSVGRVVFGCKRRLLSICGRTAFTVPEALAAMLIAGLASSALLLAAGHCLHATEAARQEAHASYLAEMLMNEISACRWADADQPDNWGPEPGEDLGPGRTLYDDLDDYDGWSGPPDTKNGTTLDALQTQYLPEASTRVFNSYTLSVTVQYVTETGQPVSRLQTTPFRQVTVTVSQGSRVLYTLTRTFADLAGMEESIWYVQ